MNGVATTTANATASCCQPRLGETEQKGGRLAAPSERTVVPNTHAAERRTMVLEFSTQALAFHPIKQEDHANECGSIPNSRAPW